MAHNSRQSRTYTQDSYGWGLNSDEDEDDWLAEPEPVLVHHEFKFEEIMRVKFLPNPGPWSILRDQKSLTLSSDSVSSTFELLHKATSTSLFLIDRRAQLVSMMAKLAKQKVLGVDVECSAEGYTFTVCTIQISTKCEDYIVDAYKLKGHVKILSEIFSNPNIVKVFHGCANDLKWLQQHFEIRVVNLFDTQVAMQHLGSGSLSLKVALKELFNVDQDPKFQRADFRIRPLPLELKTYARMDSKFLIAMYTLYVDELKKHGLLDKVRSECKRRSKIVFKIDKDSHSSVKKSVMHFQRMQITVFEKLSEWRAEVGARYKKDPEEILSTDAMVKLTLVLPQKPDEVKSLIKCKYIKDDITKFMDIMSSVSYGKNKSGKSIQPCYADVDPIFTCVGGVGKNYIENYHQMQLKLLEELNTWRHETGKKLDVQFGAILSNDALRTLVLQQPHDKREIFAPTLEFRDKINRIMILVRRNHSKMQPNYKDCLGYQVGPNRFKTFPDHRGVSQYFGFG